jgi:formate-dependent nitrite reductase membrane component NrfD
MLGTGYYGLPFLKPPVWKWMIAVYFFIGGLAGMSGLIAVAALMKGQYQMVRVAMWSAGMGGILSPVLLTWDLGRPTRFLNMLRVFKYQSPMSVGSWIVSAFGACAVPGLGFVEWHWQNMQGGQLTPAVQIIAAILVIGSGMAGIFLATYTGALIAVTAVPAWNLHRVLLPFHFGMAGLGSASAMVELAGFRQPALNVIGLFAASAQVLVMLYLELRKHGAADRALHEGKSGWVLRIGEALEGPLALALRAAGLVPEAAIAFLLGALISRFGWLSAGTACANDPEAVLASQCGDKRLAESRFPHALEPATASSQQSRSSLPRKNTKEHKA